MTTKQATAEKVTNLKDRRAEKAARAAAEKIAGMPAAKLSDASITTALEKLGLGGDGLSLEAKVLLLKEHFAALDPETLAGPCDVCGAHSPEVEFETCPFCGVGDSPEHASSAVTAPGALVAGAAAGLVLDVPTNLDDAVAEILSLMREGLMCQWKVAKKTLELDKSEIWKTRKSAAGAVAYTKFSQFAAAELGMDRKYAQDLERSVTEFSAAELDKHGPTKLRLLLDTSGSERAELLGKLDEGATRDDIARLKRERKSGVKESSAKPSAKPSPTKKSAAKGGAPTTQISMAIVEGSHKIALYVKGADKTAPLKPAKRLADNPWGHWDLANDVRLFLHIAPNANGDLIAKITVKRVSPG